MVKSQKQEFRGKQEFVEELTQTLEDRVRRKSKKPFVLTVSVTKREDYFYMLAATFEKNHSRYPKQFMHYHPVEEPSINYAEEYAERFLEFVYRKIPRRLRPKGQKKNSKPDHYHTLNSGTYTITF